MNLKKSQIDKCGTLDFLLVVPITKEDKQTGEVFLSDFGYILSERPCEHTCIPQISSKQYKTTEWEQSCECGDFMKFNYVGDYVNTIQRLGKKLEDVTRFFQMHLFFKGKWGMKED